MTETSLILNYGRCSWGRCFFCGYGRIAGKIPKAEDIISEFRIFFDKIDGEADGVKVFGSGSFLDERQVPAEARRYFIEECRRRKFSKVTIESRPEHITKEKLGEFSGLDLNVAIGLEVADDGILRRINKGFSVRDYDKAADLVKSCGFAVRTYLLANPPYAGDMKETLRRSVEHALKKSDSIVIINLLPHGNTPLVKTWLSGEWNYLSKGEFRRLVKEYEGDPRIEFDEETFRFTPMFPDRRTLAGVGEEYLTHPYFDVWQDYINRWYSPPEGMRVLLFLPCAFKKPYSESETHKAIAGALNRAGARGRLHEVMLSNAGVIPREFEDCYPFNAYDWDEKLETPEVKERYIEVTARRIGDYLKAHSSYYDRITCYLRYDSESYKALEIACKKAGAKFKNLLSKETAERLSGDSGMLKKPESLKDLEEGVKCLLQDSM